MRKFIINRKCVLEFIVPFKGNWILSLIPVCVLLLLNACVKEIAFETNNFESILVVDATITNEEKIQEITLSRTFEFGEVDENPEEGAQVKVIGDGVEYIFQQTEPGTYQSTVAFSAQPTVMYQLQIITSDGEHYSSSKKQLTTPTQIDNLYAQRIVNDDGIDGVAILVDSVDPTNTSNFYRYTFEETYKIVAPMWRTKDLIVTGEFPVCEVIIDEQPRPEEQKVCYTSENSTGINITSTLGLGESILEGYVAHFLPSDDFKISHRYSILLYQYVISEEAYRYLEIVQSFTSQGSLFSQVQTGFVVGNITASTNPEQKVIGVFDVVSVVSERLYFNYEDFYPNTFLPPFAITCTQTAPSPSPPLGARQCGPLVNLVNQRLRVYLDEYNGVPEFSTPTGDYLVVPQACGDCTALGEPEPPAFWVE